MADYDAGSVGGISVGATQHAGVGWHDQMWDAGDNDLDKLIAQNSVGVPLEPIYDVGAYFNLGQVSEGGGGAEAIRNIPLLVRTTP